MENKHIYVAITDELKLPEEGMLLFNGTPIRFKKVERPLLTRFLSWLFRKGSGTLLIVIP